jgi:alanine racemase
MSAEPAEMAPETRFTHGPPEAEAGGVLTINLGAIEANWKKLRALANPADCAAVVKGDGYGCGLEPVTAQLYHAGCTTFFVADLSEGRRARAVAPEAVIYVLDGLMPGTGPAFAEHYLQPVIGSTAELAEWDTFCGVSDWHGGFALHVDTGMNRLGVSIDEAASIAPRLGSENHGMTLLMSHFVSAENPENARNHEQMLAFREIRRMFRGVPASLANASGIFLGRSALCDLVRPGVALYGLNPTPGKPNPMQRVVDLKARVLVVRNVESGQTIGYNATWTARRRSRVAVIGVGYADGFLRAASADDNKRGGGALVGAQRCPIVGRISMDLTAIDVTDVPNNAVKRGDLVTLIGEGLELEEVAENAGTIGYEILTGLGHRYARIYESGHG